MGTKEGKDWSWHAKEDAESRWLGGVWGHGEQGKGSVSKDTEGPWKETGFIHVFVQGWAGPTYFLPPSPTHYCSTWTATSSSSSSFPPVSLGSTHILPRLQRKLMLTIAKKIPGPSCVPCKQLRLWRKVGNLRKHFHKGPDICDSAWKEWVLCG